MTQAIPPRGRLRESTSSPSQSLDTTAPDSAIPPPAGRGAWRGKLDAFLHGPAFTRTVTALIVINAALLGLETSEAVMSSPAGLPIRVGNQMILGFFVVELAAKLIARGLHFFRSGWNIFDLLVVGISLVPVTGGLEVLRTLRVLRVLRLLSQVKRLRDIVEAIGRALSGMAWVSLLLLLVFYVFGVMGTDLYGQSQPEYFGDLGRTMYTLFQVMTFDSWSSGIARPTMESAPMAWLFFVPFILVSSFMVLNLFIAIIVNATQSVHGDERLDVESEILHELRELRSEVAALREHAGGGAGDLHSVGTDEPS